MKTLWFYLFLSLAGFVNAQNQNNIWYFGVNAGITFNTTPPTALTNGMLNTQEGCASICDDMGNLLFYTDGTTVFNSNHSVMPNGTGLFGDYSSTQSAVIVPLPGSTTIYYIFTLDAFAGPSGVCYSIVDMTLDGGLGDVTTKNQIILATAAEKVVVSRHSNNSDFWIVIHGWGNNEFRSYLFSSTGLNMTPVISSIGSVYSGGGGVNNAANAIGYMKINQACNMIAVAICIQDKYELFQFNNSSGVLSNLITINDPDNSGVALAYAMEFSPDNHYLYIKNFYSQNVYQYDVSVYNQTTINNSKSLVGTVSGAANYYTGAMQMGPDNKIYIVEYNTPFLSVINNPNNPAASCNLVDNAISLNGRLGQLGLPCLVNHSFFNNPVVTASGSGCYNGIYHFYLSDSTSITGVVWNFDDPASGASNSSTLFSPTHVFSAPGNYHVTAIVSFPSGPDDTTSVDILVSNQPDVILQDSAFACVGASWTASAQGVWSQYLWSNASTASSIQINQSGHYSVTVTDSAGCHVSDEVFVQFGDTTLTVLDTSFCEGESILIEGQTINSFGTYTFTYQTVSGCDSIIQVNVLTESSPLVDLPDDTTLCFGESLYLYPAFSASYDYFEWSDGYSSFGRTITSEGLYTISVENECGDDSEDILVLFDSCLSEIWFPNVFTPNGDHINPLFKPEGLNILDFHIMIFNRWGQLLYEGFSFGEGWDGTFRGRECPEGVYFWISDYALYRNGVVVQEDAKGSVTLFR